MRYLGASSSVAGAGVLVAAAYGDSTPSVAIESEIPVAARKESTPPAAPIALGLQAGRDWAIVLAQPDGSQTRTVVGGFRLSPEPALSPDASSVVFSSRTGGRSSVQTIKADGTGRRRLSPPGIDAYSPSWSPDGRRIVFEGVDPISGLTSIDVVDVDGSGFSRLTDYGRDEAPDWAPDGRKIVFAARDDIYSMNADGTGRTAVTHFSRLPLGGRPRALSPRWSPDGRWILFTKLLQHPSGDDGEFTIALIRPDGTGEHQIRTTGGAPLAPRWTPDGTRIVFQICCTKGRVDAGTVPSDGGATSFIARGEPAAVQQEKAAAGSNPDAGASAAVKAATRLPAGARAMSAALTGPSITFTRNDLDLRPFGQATEGNNVADIDGDGKLDIVVAGDNAIVWYHNPDWTPHLIATGRYGAGAMVLPLDVNGDGLIDIVTGSQNNPSCTEYCRTLWLENTGSDWVEHTIAETAYCHDLAVGDLNGDGRPDLACDNQISRRILWMEAPADPTQPWPVTMIDDRDAMGIDVADMDGDGRLDVVAGRAWYRNETSGGWTRYAFTTLAQTCCSTVFDDFEKVNVKDVNGDGRPDVLATLFTDTPLGQVWAFLAPADPLGGGWTSVQIDAGPRFSVHGQAVASFDGTSAVQFAVGETNYGGWSFGANPSPELNVYRLDGAADQPSSWEKILVDRQGAHELRAADLDGDGLPDLTGDFENTDRLNPPTDGALHWWINTTTAGAGGTPQNVALPSIAGATREGNLLEATTGSWTASPDSFAYQWLDCDSGGAACTAVTGAESATYVLSAGDVGGTVRVRVTATNAAGPAAATSAATGVIGIAAADGVPPGFDSVVTDAGCTGCTVTTLADGSFRAAVAGGTTDNDSAYAQLDFGGNTGLLGKTYVRTVVQLENGKSPSANLAILQERDVSGNLIYELYIAPDRTLRIYSPSGGISELGENSTTGVVVPNDGTTAVRVEVAALANSSMVVRVNGVDKLTFDPLARATTGNPRFLRVGIDHYGAPATNDPISVVHASVAVTQAGWPGAPPRVAAGKHRATDNRRHRQSLGQVLTAANGTWSNSPTGFVYQWQRCDAGGANCAAIGGATDPTYMLVCRRCREHDSGGRDCDERGRLGVSDLGADGGRAGGADDAGEDGGRRVDARARRRLFGGVGSVHAGLGAAGEPAERVFAGRRVGHRDAGGDLRRQRQPAGRVRRRLPAGHDRRRPVGGLGRLSAVGFADAAGRRVLARPLGLEHQRARILRRRLRQRRLRACRLLGGRQPARELARRWRQRHALLLPLRDRRPNRHERTRKHRLAGHHRRGLRGAGAERVDRRVDWQPDRLRVPVATLRQRGCELLGGRRRDQPDLHPGRRRHREHDPGRGHGDERLRLDSGDLEPDRARAGGGKRTGEHRPADDRR